MSPIRTSTSGFNLVELTITLLISSIIYTGFLTFFFELTKTKSENLTKERINQIELAIGKYLILNGTLPCPASRLDSSNSVTLGVATDCTLSSATGTTDVSAVTPALRIGAVPTTALNINPLYMIDGWGNKYTYAVVKNLATTPSSFSSYSASGTGPFTLKDKNANQINSSSDISYILISHGEKGYGAYSADGIQGKACGTTLESENCNNDNIFVNAEYYGTNNSSYFDDIVKWKTRGRLIKANKLAIALP